MKKSMYQASRWTKGNFFFPDRLYLEEESIKWQKRQWIGGESENIRYEQIASVSVQKGFLFADLLFETTGGSEPVFLNGMWAGQAESAQAELKLKMNIVVGSQEDRMLEILEEQTVLLRSIASSLKSR